MSALNIHALIHAQAGMVDFVTLKNNSTEIPTIIDPSATINYPSATGSIIVGISVGPSS